MGTNTTETKQRRKLCFVVSAPMTAVVFLNGHIDHLADQFEITVVCNFDGSESQVSQNATLKNIKITRPISPVTDLLAIWRLNRYLRQERFEIVHSVTPKAGLVTAVSGWLARIPIRIHWFTGQVWVLAKGPKRWLLRSLDKLIARLDTDILIDSSSQRDFLLKERVVCRRKSQVLGNGSIAGVDTSRFRPSPEVKECVRKELGIHGSHEMVIVFLGRIHNDKGVNTLFEAFRSNLLHGDPYLILVGPDEAGLGSNLKEKLGPRLQKFRHIPFTNVPENFLAAADIFCLPSLREGFGLSILEAGAVALPSVATRIYGITDAVEENYTGFLVSPGDADDLVTALNALLTDPEKRLRMGLEARKRVETLWKSTVVQEELSRFYSNLLSTKNA